MRSQVQTMRYIAILLSLIALSAGQHAAAQSSATEEAQLTPEQQQYLAAAREFWNSLQRKQGEVELPNGVATLNVPETFYYLGPADSERVLVEVWGNPPGAGQNTLGMLFPNEYTPFDQGAWAVTIEYEEDGYVSDEDADEINYAKLLSQMKKATKEASKERVNQGYEPIQLVGWASQPFYDKASHKLHWAKEIKFGDQEVNTLNYNIRVLGRKGVLVLNFIADMSQKEVIDANINTVLALAEFNPGSRYQDFDPSIDKVAAYGLGALVAGKIAAKTGFLAAVLIALKKFWIFIVIGIAALFGKLFRRKPAQAG